MSEEQETPEGSHADKVVRKTVTSELISAAPDSRFRLDFNVSDDAINHEVLCKLQKSLEALGLDWIQFYQKSANIYSQVQEPAKLAVIGRCNDRRELEGQVKGVTSGLEGMKLIKFSIEEEKGKGMVHFGSSRDTAASQHTNSDGAPMAPRDIRHVVRRDGAQRRLELAGYSKLSFGTDITQSGGSDLIK